MLIIFNVLNSLKEDKIALAITFGQFGRWPRVKQAYHVARKARRWRSKPERHKKNASKGSVSL